MLTIWERASIGRPQMDRVNVRRKIASKIQLAEVALSASFPNAALAFPVSGEEGAEFWMVGE